MKVALVDSILHYYLRAGETPATTRSHRLSTRIATFGRRTMSVETNKTLVRRLFKDDLSEGSATVADEIFHQQFYDRTNPPGMQHGIEGHRAIVSLFRTAFPDQVWQVDHLIGEDDKVVA